MVKTETSAHYAKGIAKLEALLDEAASRNRLENDPGFGGGFAGKRSRVGQAEAGYWDFIRPDASCILSVTNAVYRDPAWMHVPRFASIKIRILLSGRFHDADGRLVAQAPCLQVERCLGKQDGGFRIEAGDVRYLVVSLPPERFADLVASRDPQLVDTLLAALDTTEGGGRLMLPLDGAIIRASEDIFQAPELFDGELCRLYLQARTQEILCHALRAMCEGRFLARNPVSSRDLAHIDIAQTVLRERFAQPPTIAALARQIGLNQTKLKILFKHVTGTTIQGFVRHLRMEAATAMLMETDLSVAEIAYATGYQYPANFTIAYRRHFGCVPSNSRRQLHPVR